MLEKIEKKSTELHLEEEFISYSDLPNKKIKITTNQNTYLTKNLIFAIPPVNLKKIKKIPNLLSNITIQIPLCRMYAIYPSNNYWYF